MRLETLRIKGFGPFKQELAIDFARDYGDAKLVAITGENGAGKTTMLELGIPGAMFRSTPTRGSLTELATTRDAMLEVGLVNGQPWTIRHLVDRVSGKAEAVVLDAAGAAVLPDAKVRSFDAWAAKHLPSPEVLFTSIFGAQGADGFLGMKPGERKAVLLRCLGIERFEGLAERARERAKAQKTKIETLEARMADERGRQSENGLAAGVLAVKRDELAVLLLQVKSVRSDLAIAEADAAASAEARRLATEAAERRVQLSTALQNAQTQKAAIEQRIANCRAEVGAAAKIRAAAAELAVLDAAVAELRVELSQLEGQVANAEAEHTAARELLAAIRSEKRDAEERIQRLTERLADEGKVSRAAAALPERRAALEAARAEVARLEQASQKLDDQRFAGADERISWLRHGLAEISSGSSNARNIASARLAADDDVARAAAEAPARLAATKRALGEARAGVAPIEREVIDLERLAARAPEFASARTELAAARAALPALMQRETDADGRAKAAHEACEPIRATVQRKLSESYKLRGERDPVAALAVRVERLAKAETMLGEREKQLANTIDEIAHFEAQISATPEPAPPSPAPDVAAYRKAVEDTERSLREAAAAVARAEQHHEADLASVARLGELQAERAGLDEELADWNRVAADLGRDGLQAQLIDAAIPELNHVANELLHEAFGPRFTVDVRTQALDAKGKRTLETLDVVVIDTVNGREALAETYSGGERVIIQEALSLALTVLACRQNGVEQPTLIRDESGAALSEGRAAQWIAMLPARRRHHRRQTVPFRVAHGCDLGAR